MPVSRQMNRSPIRETLEAGIIAGASGADTRVPILPLEKPGDPWLQPPPQTFHLVSRWVAGRRPRGRFFPCRRFWAEARPRLGRNWTMSIHCESRRTRWDAMNTTSSGLSMRLKPAPCWLAYSNRLNFFSAAYNELLALLSRDLCASDWLCA